MELLNDIINSKPRVNKTKKKSKPFNERRVLTRSIIRNKLKFELKKLGYPKVNKNFRYILAGMSNDEKLKLLNK